MSQDLLEKAQQLLEIESGSILRASQRLGSSFIGAVRLIETEVSNGKKLVLIGVGKSHYVALKLVASFLSTGVNAVFVHPSEALHGDLGAINPGDVCILFSKSGSTSEILDLLPFLKGRNPLIALTGGLDSPLAQKVDWVIDAGVEQEACPINMVPTASTTVAMAIGDALVAVLMELRNFKREDFAHYHPGGSIGKRLNFVVEQLAIKRKDIAIGAPDLSIQEVAIAMGQKPLGAFCVLDNEKMIGIITEGDLRRAIAQGRLENVKASDLMTRKFISLEPHLRVAEAIERMEHSGKKVGCAPLLDVQGKLLGLLRIHDIL